MYKEQSGNRDTIDKCFKLALALEDIDMAEAKEKLLLTEDTAIHTITPTKTTPKPPDNFSPTKICKSCGESGHFSAAFNGCKNHNPNFGNSQNFHGGRFAKFGHGNRGRFGRNSYNRRFPDNKRNPDNFQNPTGNATNNDEKPKTYEDAKRQQICGYCGKTGHNLDSCFSLPSDF